MALAARTRVTLLDGFALRLGGDSSPLRDVPRAVQRLVVRLGISRCPDRTAIAGQLWPDVPEDRSHGSLRSALWRLQKVAPGTVEASGGSLSLAEGVRVDVRELEAWAERVLDPCIPGDDVGLPEDALCGELLPGWYEDWVLLERERLRQLRMHALEALADKLVTLRRYGEATEAAYAAVHAEPLRESAHRVVVRVHLAEGNITEALRAYDSFRTMLADELGISPTWQMTRCIAQAERRRDEWQGLPGHVHPDRPQRHGGGPDGGVRRIDQAGATIGTGRAGGVSAASTCPPAEQSPSPVVVEGPRR